MRPDRLTLKDGMLMPGQTVTVDHRPAARDDGGRSQADRNGAAQLSFTAS
ncbi:MAG: hypothetical protein Q8R78_05400 [Candidatus Omnitrophota bacterium]|nr:hypothetical protein [Candidatus Omnitrophota bacterium]